MKTTRRAFGAAALAAAITFGALGPTPAPAGATVANENFVHTVYEDFLRRSPNATELSTWTTSLDGGGSRSSMVSSLLNSSEFKLLWVTSMRLHYLGDLAFDDPTIPTDHSALVSSGDFVAAEVSVLAGSTFFAANGSTNNGYVTAVYQKVLYRSPSAGDLSYWAGQITSGARTRSQVAKSIIRSAEAARRRVAGPSSATACAAVGLGNSNGLASGSYCIVLDRMGDAGGIDYWTGVLTASTQLPTLWVSLASSAEYLTLSQDR